MGSRCPLCCSSERYYGEEVVNKTFRVNVTVDEVDECLPLVGSSSSFLVSLVRSGHDGRCGKILSG